MAVPPTVERLLAAVRPHPHRGDLIAAAAVPLTVGVFLTEVRFDGVWGRGVLFVLAALATALVLGMGLLAPLEEERPRAYQTVLLVAGLALLALTIVRLAQVLGEDSPLAASGTVTWMATLFAAVAAVAAWRLRSPICALIEFVAGGVTLLAFVQWVFDPRGPNTSRWLLLVLILVYAGVHVRLRESWPRHAVHAVNAAGLAAIVLAVSYLGRAFVPVPVARGGHAGTGWELVLLAVGFALIAYAAVDREPGPAYLGFVVLVLFVVLAGPPSLSGASLIGWPILLLLLGGAGVAAGLRPRRDLPPEPGPPEPPPPRPLTGDEPTQVQR
ncbi:MAG TPA: hypothetical protein VGN78_07285 [Solirubrobacteraceae bacterium]|nr:hypothetical protein [Solirubrobacteraceae bacterium]